MPISNCELIMNQFMLMLKTESRYKKKLTAESCFHLHKILDCVTQ